MMPYGYQQMVPVNYQMPQYLSVPEVRYEGQGFVGLMGRVALRSVMKSLGHSMAHLFDTTPLGGPGTQGSGPSGGSNG